MARYAGKKREEKDQSAKKTPLRRWYYWADWHFTIFSPGEKKRGHFFSVERKIHSEKWAIKMDYINNRASMRLFDTESGEVPDIEINPGDKVRIIRASTIEAHIEMSKEYVPLNDGRHFVKIFPDVLVKLCRRVGRDGVLLLNMLLPYVGANSGVLRHRNGTFVTRQFIVEECNDIMSRSSVDRALSLLVRHGVLGKCYVKDKKAYIMNPYIYQNGSKANATLLTLFSRTEWIQ